MIEDKKLTERLILIYLRESYTGFGENNQEDKDFIKNNKFVVFIDEQSAKNGFKSDVEAVQKLKFSHPYTLKSMHVGRNSSSIILEELPEQSFNSVNFKFAEKYRE